MRISTDQLAAIMAADNVRDFAYAVRKAAIVIHPEDDFASLVNIEDGQKSLGRAESVAISGKLDALWNDDDEDRWNDWIIGTTKADAEFRISGAVVADAMGRWR